MIATERDIEGVAGGRREWQWVHQIIADRRPAAVQITDLIVTRTLELAPDVKTSDPCASPARALENMIVPEFEPASQLPSNENVPRMMPQPAS